MVFINKTNIMATVSFTIAYSTDLESISGLTPSTTVYAEDLGLCNSCVDLVGSCWACLVETQQVFNNPELTNPVVDGYYKVHYNEDGNAAIWHIVGGFPQTEEFFN
jgi:hypothetical protein